MIKRINWSFIWEKGIGQGLVIDVFVRLEVRTSECKLILTYLKLSWSAFHFMLEHKQTFIKLPESYFALMFELDIQCSHLYFTILHNLQSLAVVYIEDFRQNANVCHWNLELANSMLKQRLMPPERQDLFGESCQVSIGIYWESDSRGLGAGSGTPLSSFLPSKQPPNRELSLHIQILNIHFWLTLVYKPTPFW